MANQAIFQSLQEAQQIFNPPAAAPAAYAPAPLVRPQSSPVACFGASNDRWHVQALCGPQHAHQGPPTGDRVVWQQAFEVLRWLAGRPAGPGGKPSSV